MSDAKFKQTEIGLIPEGWETKALGELLSVGSGKSYKHLSMGNVPVYGTGGLMCFVDDYLYDGETVCIGRKGTINVPYYHEGKIWTVDTLFFTHSFNGLIPKYAYYLFLTINWLSKNEASGVPSLSRSNIEQTKVAVPPIAEQERIASALSAVDELIASLDKQIAKTRDTKQGVMQQLLTGKTRLAGFSSQWTESELKTHATICKGIQFNKADMNVTGSYPVINGGIEASGYIEQYNNDEDTITVSQGGASAGYVNWLSQKFWAGAHCYVVKPDESVDNKYLYYVLKFNELAFMGSKYGGNIPALSVSTLLDFSMPVPPLEEQKHIASVLSSLDGTITGLDAKRQKYESVKAGMMQQLLSGAIRLN